MNFDKNSASGMNTSGSSVFCFLEAGSEGRGGGGTLANLGRGMGGIPIGRGGIPVRGRGGGGIGGTPMGNLDPGNPTGGMGGCSCKALKVKDTMIGREGREGI